MAAASSSAASAVTTLSGLVRRILVEGGNRPVRVNALWESVRAQSQALSLPTSKTHFKRRIIGQMFVRDEVGGRSRFPYQCIGQAIYMASFSLGSVVGDFSFFLTHVSCPPLPVPPPPLPPWSCHLYAASKAARRTGGKNWWLLSWLWRIFFSLFRLWRWWLRSGNLRLWLGVRSAPQGVGKG